MGAKAPQIQDILLLNGESTLYSSHDGNLLEDIESLDWSNVSLTDSFASSHADSESISEELLAEKSNTRAVPDCEEEIQDGFFSKHLMESALVPQCNGEHAVRSPILESVKDSMTFRKAALRSNSSSTQTLCPSPRSDIESPAETPNSRNQSEEPFKPWFTNHFRERCPSDPALKLPHGRILRDRKLSSSLQDVSQHPFKNSRRSSPTIGRPLSSITKSKDSGFTHSGSLLSLGSSTSNYDHVQSKVKQYIQNLKESGANRRKQKEELKSPKENYSVKQGVVEEDDFPVDSEELKKLVAQMKCDMKDKDLCIMKLHEAYVQLLEKYAEAEIKIENLRFKCLSNSSQPDPRNHPPPKVNFRAFDEKQTYFSKSHIPMNTEKKTEVNSHTELDKHIPDKTVNSVLTHSPPSIIRKPKVMKDYTVSAPLQPIKKLYSSSIFLNRVMEPLSNCSSSNDMASDSSISRKDDSWIKSEVEESPKRGKNSTNACKNNSKRLEIVRQISLPVEDLSTKVDRWQSSVSKSTSNGVSNTSDNSTSRSKSAISPIHEESTYSSKKTNSVGLQVGPSLRSVKIPNEGKNASPRISHGINSDDDASFNIPRLNLRSFSEESSEQCSEICHVRSCQNDAYSKSNWCCTRSLNNPAQVNCHNRCDGCDCAAYLEANEAIHWKKRWKKAVKLCQKLRDAVEPREETSALFISKSSLPSSPEEKNQVVPSSPSLRQSGKILLVNNYSNCTFPQDSSYGRNDISHLKFSTDGNDDLDAGDTALLQCLEEIDKYANQIWDKTASCLTVSKPHCHMIVKDHSIKK